MDEEVLLKALYEKLYTGMLEKDGEAILSCMTEDAAMIHMTEMVQTPESFVSSVLDGTLNYYKVITDRFDVELSGDRAKSIGYSRVTAAVYGGGRHEWRLRMDMVAVRIGESWKIKEVSMSTY